LQLPRS